MIRSLLCAAAAALAVAAPAAAFGNTEPLAADQWYLEQDHAWSYWPSMPALHPVKVAVIDSGVDYGHPDLAGRIAAGRSFVPGSWKVDTDGHGTFVAGLIAANPDNHQGIAGLAFNARLLVAKVVLPDGGGVYLPGEVAAIRWAVREGARVINLSVGGTRDPVDQRYDSYSPAEASAVEYAISKGVVVIAAAGNGTQAPSMPWPYADYPAALPHVLGVAAAARDGAVPAYSNRDPVYVDLTAPGDDIVSTIPRKLVDAAQPGCAGVPYSTCGSAEYRDAIGTSFATPQVSAAAALLLGVDPSLTADQVVWLLERSASDMTPATGCAGCRVGRDALSGWGLVDVQRALDMLARHDYPPPDRYEPNDDAGTEAHRLPVPDTISASLDFWDDPVDVYALRLRRGSRLYVRLSPSTRGAVSVSLWPPGTVQVLPPDARPAERLETGSPVQGQERLAYGVGETGVYYLELRCVPPARGRIGYTLALASRSR